MHVWVMAKQGYEYCSVCGLFEWLAGIDSVCSRLYGVAEEVD